ncbi:MAG: hypothetical protein WAM78_22130 [Candidatus Sulfotelmatobacter sp.]
MELPLLEDANSIQVSLMQIMRLIIAGHIDGKTAGLLLYALQTASANIRGILFTPYMRSMVLDPTTVDKTPLGAYIWDDSDFITAEDEAKNEAARRAQALEEAQRKARKKAELDRWAEAEANRLSAIGIRQREAERQAERKQAAEERAVITPPLAKRPPANVSLDEVRKKVTAQIIKALPEIAAAQAARENGNRRG